MQLKARILEMDMLRGFAILILVIYHTAGYFTLMANRNLLYYTNLYIDVTLIVVVPAFVIISGASLAFNYTGKFDPINFYKKRALAILPPYIIFTIVYTIVDAFVLGIEITPLRFAAYLLTGTAYSHLWYFVMLIQLYLLFPFLIRAYDSTKKKIRPEHMLATCLAIQIVFNIFILYTMDWIGPSVISDLIYARFFVSYIFYFVLGIYIARNYEAIKGFSNAKIVMLFSIISLAISLMISLNWDAQMNIFGTYTAMPHATFTIDMILQPLMFTLMFVALFGVSTYLLRKDRGKWLRELGKHSFGIYLVHYAYILICIISLSNVGIGYDDAAFYIITVTATLALSYVTVKAISRMPYGHIIVGR